MTQTEKRIAILRACGWEEHENAWSHKDAPGEWCAFPETPDPLNDLNAMHAAWETLNEYQRGRYDLVLVDLLCPELPHGKPPLYIEACSAINATAAQRAEAFGLTLGLWPAESPAVPPVGL